MPQVVEIILEESGETLPASVRGVLLAAAAVFVAVSAALTRIMAIPQVELTRGMSLRRVRIIERDLEVGQHQRGRRGGIKHRARGRLGRAVF